MTLSGSAYAITGVIEDVGNVGWDEHCESILKEVAEALTEISAFVFSKHPNLYADMKKYKEDLECQKLAHQESQ